MVSIWSEEQTERSGYPAHAPDVAKWRWGPRASPAKRVAWGEEEQGSERSFRRKAETKLSGLCSDVAGMAGLEPANEGVKVPCLTTWLHPCVMSRCAASEETPLKLHPAVAGYPPASFFLLSQPDPLRSRWQLCCLTDAAYPSRVHRWAPAGFPAASRFAVKKGAGRSRSSGPAA